MKLHPTDIRILKELQQDADQTNLSLAEKVGLSPPACLKRVQKLKADGVIERIVAIVSHDAIDRRLNIIVEVEMTTDTHVAVESFIKKINNSPEVKQCYKVTGEVDFVLVVNVRGIFEFDEFCQRVIYSHEYMKKFTSLISVNCTKFDLSQGGLSSV